MTTEEVVPGTAPDFGPALIIATSAALLTLAPVAASQLGLLNHLPDPPGRIFASDRITESPLAHPLGMPDSLLGIASYSTTLALMLLARQNFVARKLLGAKLIADGAAAAFNLVRQMTHFRRICSWCTATAICTAFMVAAGRRLIACELTSCKPHPIHLE